MVAVSKEAIYMALAMFGGGDNDSDGDDMMIKKHNTIYPKAGSRQRAPVPYNTLFFDFRANQTKLKTYQSLSLSLSQNLFFFLTTQKHV
ncbi:hypothetical protein QVD17_36449 [Tagetes erecta]|uniref:Uncharacterized protein n=1 Tax=Tagetes erecta TaxID=13708 RepID=A0AAD8JUX2_TARER|nr:hypothetical protein QVD17_36449 [Tagetes erecta]